MDVEQVKVISTESNNHRNEQLEFVAIKFRSNTSLWTGLRLFSFVRYKGSQSVLCSPAGIRFLPAHTCSTKTDPPCAALSFTT